MTAVNVNSDIHSSLGLLAPCRVITVDVAAPVSDIRGLGRYQTALVVFTEHGTPVGASVMQVHGDRCRADELLESVKQHSDLRLRVQIRHRLREVVGPDGISSEELGLSPVDVENRQNQPVSVVIPTRNRPALLKKCLASVMAQADENVEIIVVDSAPDNNASEAVAQEFATVVKYLCVDTVGASIARNSGADLAGNEILVFLDDDACVEPGCLLRLSQAFSLHPAIDAVTTLVIPDDMTCLSETKFEAMGGFNCGFQRRWIYRSSPDIQFDPVHVNLSQLGTSTCCAVRKSSLVRAGGFSARFGPGSGGFHSGEDLDLFFRIVEAGGILLYEPSAMVRHKHRDREAAVCTQVVDGAAAASSVWARITRQPAANRGAAVKAYKRYRAIAFKSATQASVRPDVLPASVYWKRWLAILREYYLSRIVEFSPMSRFAPDSLRRKEIDLHDQQSSLEPHSKKLIVKVIRLDLGREVEDYLPYGNENAVEFQVFSGMRYRGRFRVPLIGGVITKEQILDGVSDYVGPSLIGTCDALQVLNTANSPVAHANADSWVYSKRCAFRPEVSVVVPTRDRPSDLETCLAALMRQDYDGNFEVIVVDNNPASGLTSEVVERYSFCRYEKCYKPGAAASRNHGFRVAKGEIIAITDDDVIVPPCWIRQIVSPFWRHDVWMVTGSILPWSLETDAEQQFEAYGGFDFFDKVTEASAHWYRGRGTLPIPVWRLGTSGNMAFRTRIVEDSSIGEMREYLGPGTPAGAGEDLYFVYRLLKEGHTLLHDPSIWVYHRHRRVLVELRRQVFNYGMSQVCYQLETLFRDGDLRALRMLFFDIPRFQFRRLVGLEPMPPGLLGREVGGHFAGIFTYFISKARSRILDRHYANDSGRNWTH